MGEIVMHNKSETKEDGSLVNAEERAEYLLKNGYPVPTEDLEELTILIANQMKRDEEAEIEKLKNENPSLSPKT